MTSGKFRQEGFPLLKWHRINANEEKDWPKPVLDPKPTEDQKKGQKRTAEAPPEVP